jgi:hypothetical protein
LALLVAVQLEPQEGLQLLHKDFAVNLEAHRGEALLNVVT